MKVTVAQALAIKSDFELMAQDLETIESKYALETLDSILLKTYASKMKKLAKQVFDNIKNEYVEL